MRIRNPRHQIAKGCCVILFSGLMAASSWATLVWDLNPLHQDGALGSSSHTYTSMGFSIIAYGFDNPGGIGLAHGLFYKSDAASGGAGEFGNVPNFGQHNFYSIVAAADDVFPISFAADLPPVPGVSTLLSEIAAE
jgi:hypothetical protein